MAYLLSSKSRKLGQLKFSDPLLTEKGEERAIVTLTRLNTIWFNTGSLCNITCKNCFMKSSPTNDDLSYLSLSQVAVYLDEIAAESLPVEEVAFTGGEPFMNPEFLDMVSESLARGFRVLVLTNAMKPLLLRQKQLCRIKEQYGDLLVLRVSIDHYTRKGHEEIRGRDSWEPMMEGLQWLSANNFNLDVAGRTCWNETEKKSRAGYGRLFRNQRIRIDENDSSKLVLFPEMDITIDVPEISAGCWGILGVDPETMMCASSRMIVQKKNAHSSVVVPCTLLPYEKEFELGTSLAGSIKDVHLNHPHCAKFCVLGGGSCSPS